MEKLILGMKRLHTIKSHFIHENELTVLSYNNVETEVRKRNKAYGVLLI